MTTLESSNGLALRQRSLGLEVHWDGPQLLYASMDGTLEGDWDAVLSAFPAPTVQAMSAERNLGHDSKVAHTGNSCEK